jgi:endonuclease YncB( thermonuclease family)
MVVGVTDGDTITVLDDSREQHKIRLQGIDAPEKRQPYGQRSKAHLSKLVFSKRVGLDCSKIDRYSREICVVRLDEMDVNLEQVRTGMAWWYVQYRNEQTVTQREAYRLAGQEARAEKRGLWSDSAATAPWEYRRSQKTK